MSSYPKYDGIRHADERMAACIAFELERGGSSLAAARACIRDIRLGYLAVPDPVLRGPEMGWQPIETAPKDGTNVLLYDPSWYDTPFVGRYDAGRWRTFEGIKGMMATHWMPLPTPPERSET